MKRNQSNKAELQQLAQSFRAELAFFVPTLRLTEKLRFCLLALASRYPHHSININEEILGPQTLGAEGWRATDLIKLLQNTSPQLLQAKTRLEVTAQQKGIYLLEYSEEVTAFWVYFGGVGEKTPPYRDRGNMATRHSEQAQKHDNSLGGNDPLDELHKAIQ